MARSGSTSWMRKKRVLLSFIEAMNLVDKEDRLAFHQTLRPVLVDTPARVAIAAPEKTTFVQKMRLTRGPIRAGRDGDSH